MEFGDVLRGLGSVLNPQVMQDVNAERARQQAALQAQQQQIVGMALQDQFQQAREERSPQVQAARLELAKKQRADAYFQSPRAQAHMANPDQAAGLRGLTGDLVGLGIQNPIDFLKEEIAATRAGRIVVPQGSTVVEGGKPVYTNPAKPEPPHTRNIQRGDQKVAQEFDPTTRTWKDIPGASGPAFARQVVPVVNNTYSSQGVLDPVKDKAELRDLAIQSLYDPGSLAGYRRDTKTMGAIQRERINVMRELGVTSEDVVSGRAGFKADTVSLNKITPQYDAITAFEKTAIRNGKILIELADKVDTTGVPVAERWIRAGRKAIGGDSDVAKFDAQMNLYRAEAARILTQPNLTGVLTDTARKEMEDVIRNNASAKQIREVVNLLERDFNNRKETLEEQIASIRARMRSRATPGGGPVVAPTPAPSPTQPKVVDFGSLK